MVTRTDKGEQAPTSHARFGPRVDVLRLVINATKYGFLIEPGIGFEIRRVALEPGGVRRYQSVYKLLEGEAGINSEWSW